MNTAEQSQTDNTDITVVSHTSSQRVLYSRNTLLRTLRISLWLIPILMGAIGIGYTVFEHFRHVEQSVWPWPTILGIIVLGIIGPAFTWLSLQRTSQIAKAFIESEDQLAAINQIAQAASQSLDLKTRIATVLQLAMKAMDVPAGMVFLQESEYSGLRLETHFGVSTGMAEQEAYLKPGYCLCGQAVKTHDILIAPDVSRDRRCTSNVCICEGFRSVACAPLEVKGQLVGLIQLASLYAGHFTEDKREFLRAVAGQASVSIENARLYDTVKTLNVTLEHKVNERTYELETARWALAEKARQLQQLLSESYRVQEDTQTRIAKDLHDSVTQIIIGALYEIQAARESMETEPDRAELGLAHAQHLLSEADNEMRRVIYNLHPPVLDMMGLVVALRRFATTYTETFGVECQVQVAGHPRRLPRKTEITIYRIIQAALHNVASHAQARQVEIHFRFNNALLEVEVEDDGVGFNTREIMSTPGERLGLIGMKERANSLGAELTVVSEPGEGTRIALALSRPSYSDPEAI